jgi:hypothetical protein
MRFFVRAAIPTVAGNKVIIAGKMGATIDEIAERLKPDLLFFRANPAGPTAGVKSISMVVDLEDASQVKSKIEPLLQPLGAKVEYEQVMSAADFLNALPSLEEAVRKYGDDGREG